MNLIVCLDDRNGLAFNHRRQSRDRILNNKILELTKGCPLWMSPYTASMFAEIDSAAKIEVMKDISAGVPDGAYYFLEVTSAKIFEPAIEKIYVFRWNRSYPFDTQFDIDLTKWHLTEICEFSGSSHEKITLEVYVH